jgi:hypothetical protein
MIQVSRIAPSLALVVIMAGSLIACSKPEPEAPPPAEQPAATAEVAAEQEQTQDPRALLDACNIELLEPSSIEWDTKWDPAYSRDMSKYPSGVRSAHWASEEELAGLQQANQAFPFELSCGSDAGSEYTILIEMVAVGSSLTDIPLQTGSYPIAAMGSVGQNKPGEMAVGNLQFNGASFRAREGNLTLERFDSEGAAGNFVIEGLEAGGENRVIRIEGTFDMPCRLGRMQNGCKSNKAERE